MEALTSTPGFRIQELRAEIVLMGPPQAGKGTLIAAESGGCVLKSPATLGESFVTTVRYSSGDPREAEAGRPGCAFYDAKTLDHLNLRYRNSDDLKSGALLLPSNSTVFEFALTLTKVGSADVSLEAPKVRHYLESRRGRTAAFGIVSPLPRDLAAAAESRRGFDAAVDIWLEGLSQVEPASRTSSASEPFVFFVQTYHGNQWRSGPSSALRRGYRRRAEIELFRRVGQGFLLFQIDLDNAASVKRLWRAVTCQVVDQRESPTALQSEVRVLSDASYTEELVGSGMRYTMDIVFRVGKPLSRIMRKCRGRNVDDDEHDVGAIWESTDVS